jgi:uncharacterized lipoprotein YmbA
MSIARSTATRITLSRFVSPLPLAAVTALGVVCLAGCSNLKPVRDTFSYFVLSPIQAAPTNTPAPGDRFLSVGLGPVKLPDYLLRTQLAVRKGATEVAYLEDARWAERLDAGCQRVLAANLAALLPADRVRVSAWRPKGVACEIHVALDHFDVNIDGRGVLVARWRVTAPGGGATIEAGESRFAKEGPAPEADPGGAAGTLSELLAELSRQLAAVIQTRVPREK